ncbi:MAG: hypothetical protein CM15mP117_05830 [Alphaproteobacteria bacterium]|nr:MAG: hypothetical protein CM15mP117_05830 [Alphaproteobacteria bacterium]
MMGSLVSEIDISENGMALDALKQVGPGQHFLGSEHTQSNFETAFWRSSIADYTTYEQWSSKVHKRQNQEQGCEQSKCLIRIRPRN